MTMINGAMLIKLLKNQNQPVESGWKTKCQAFMLVVGAFVTLRCLIWLISEVYK